VTHRPMVIVNHSRVDVVVGTVVPPNHYVLRLNDRQVTDRDHLVVIVVIAHNMTRDDQVSRPIAGKVAHGLARGLDPHQPIRMRRAHASQLTYKIFTKVIID